MKHLQDFYLTRFGCPQRFSYDASKEAVGDVTPFDDHMVTSMQILEHSLTLLQQTNYTDTEAYRQLLISANVVANRTLGLTDRKVTNRLFLKLFYAIRREFYQIVFVRYPCQQIADCSEDKTYLVGRSLTLNKINTKHGPMYTLYYQVLDSEHVLMTVGSLECKKLQKYILRFGGLSSN